VLWASVEGGRLARRRKRRDVAAWDILSILRRDIPFLSGSPEALDRGRERCCREPLTGRCMHCVASILPEALLPLSLVSMAWTPSVHVVGYFGAALPTLPARLLILPNTPKINFHELFGVVI